MTCLAVLWVSRTSMRPWLFRNFSLMHKCSQTYFFYAPNLGCQRALALIHVFTIAPVFCPEVVSVLQRSRGYLFLIVPLQFFQASSSRRASDRRIKGCSCSSDHGSNIENNAGANSASSEFT